MVYKFGSGSDIIDLPLKSTYFADQPGISTQELLTADGSMQDWIDVLYAEKDGETVDWYLSDQSSRLGQAYVNYMTEIVEKLDNIIDLDFNLVTDDAYSGIDVYLKVFGGEDYMGLATLESGWIDLQVVDWSSQGASRDDNKNTYS